MAEQADRIYRVSDGVVGGVCAGIARYAGIDAGLLRAFTVLFSLFSAGLLAFAYVGLWLALPQENDTAKTVDVDPASIRSETYGQVVAGSTGKFASVAPAQGAGRTPPPVPAASPSAVAFGSQASFSAGINQIFEFPGASEGDVKATPAWRVWLGVGLGVIVVVAALAVVLSGMMPRFAAEQFWPLVIVAFGIARMVVPSDDGHYTMPVVVGVMLISVGMVLLAESLGLVHARVYDWGRDCLPLVLIMMGLFVVGRGTRIPALAMCGAVVFALICVIGLLFYTDLGPVRNVDIVMPLSESSVIIWDMR